MRGAVEGERVGLVVISYVIFVVYDVIVYKLVRGFLGKVGE
jgi:hypothetical protein